MTERIALEVSEVAELLGCHRNQVYRLIDVGELPATVLGGTKYVSVRALHRILDPEGDAHAEEE